MEFNQKLRELRKKNDMSVRTLAEELDLSESSIRMYETGSRIPPSDIIIKLAKIFNVSTDYILGLKEYRGSGTISFDLQSIENKSIRERAKLINNGAYARFNEKPRIFYKQNEDVHFAVENANNALWGICSDLEDLDMSFIDFDTELIYEAIKELKDHLDSLQTHSDILLGNLEAIEEDGLNIDLDDLELMKATISDHLFNSVDLSNKTDDEIRLIYNTIIEATRSNRFKSKEKLFPTTKK